MSAPLRVLAVANRAGLQERRLYGLAPHLPDTIALTMLIEPSVRDVLAHLRHTDVVYVLEPGRKGFPAAVAARLGRKLVVVELSDPHGALFRAGGRSRAAVAAGEIIDHLVVRRADGVIVRGRGLAEVLDIRVPWVEVPDGVDTERFRPGVDGDLRTRLGIPSDALVVGLVGSLTGGPQSKMIYGWDIVAALASLRDLDVWGLVVGGGTGLATIRERASALGVADRLVTPGESAHEQIPEFVAAMDVCISTQTNDAIGRSRTTSKLPEYLAADRFVIATAVGTAAAVLPAEMLLPFEGSEDRAYPERLAGRLRELWPRRAELRLGSGTRALAVERFSYPVVAAQLAAFLQQIAGVSR